MIRQQQHHHHCYLFAFVVVVFIILENVNAWIRFDNNAVWLPSWRRSALRMSNSFPHSEPPYLAIITEPDACDSDENMEKTFEAIRRAVSSAGNVDLVSIRLTSPPTTANDGACDKNDAFLSRALELTQRLVQLSSMNDDKTNSSNKNGFKVVCSSDYIDIALRARAHGIHVKEAHLSRIPKIRESFPYPPLIGTSTHSVESAVMSFRTYRPDYYFVGTCYTTMSHPEKSAQDLEGPALPGEVRRVVDAKVLAIGGIDDTNCAEPIAYGADGVATIRAVLQADKPADVVSQLHTRMKAALEKRIIAKL